MDATMLYQLRNAPGSIGDTVKSYVKAYSKLQSQKVYMDMIFTEIFKDILLAREKAYKLIGAKDGNLLIPVNETYYKPIYKFIDEFEVDIKATMPISEYVDNSGLFKIDLPTMILYIMLLESNIKRMGFASADKTLLREILKVIHQETTNVCTYQTFFTEDEFVEENLGKLKLFLFGIDKSLAILMKMNR